jgi:hypothetical protein
LNNEQKKLIEDNFKEIFDKLTKSISGNRFLSMSKNAKDLASDALLYLPSVAMSFNPSKSNSFVKYAVNICKYRLIDEYRKYNKVRINQGVYNISLETLPGQEMFVDNKNYFQDIDNDDFKEYIISESKKFFKNQSNSTVYIKLVSNYILPKILDEKRETLSNIASESGLDISTLCLMLKNDNMSNFLKYIYKTIE